MRFGILMKGSLNAALSEQQAHRENCLIWPVIRDGWKIHQGPTWQGCALNIRSDNMTKKQSHHSATDIGLDPRTWFFSRCSSVKKSREPESKGSFKAIQSLRFGSSAVLGGHGVRDSKIKEPLLRMPEPPPLFHFFLHRHPWRFTDKPCAQGQEKYQSWTQTWGHMQTSQKNKWSSIKII